MGSSILFIKGKKIQINKFDFRDGDTASTFIFTIITLSSFHDQSKIIFQVIKCNQYENNSTTICISLSSPPGKSFYPAVNHLPTLALFLIYSLLRFVLSNSYDSSSNHPNSKMTCILYCSSTCVISIKKHMVNRNVECWMMDPLLVCPIAFTRVIMVHSY